jgi:hypothetical protein
VLGGGVTVRAISSRTTARSCRRATPRLGPERANGEYG